MASAPWIVSDELWELVEPLLPKVERRFRYPGRKRSPDRPALQGILFVLHTGIAWQHLPAELGFGSGVTCWRRLDEWQRAGVEVIFLNRPIGKSPEEDLLLQVQGMMAEYERAKILERSRRGCWSPTPSSRLSDRRSRLRP